MRKFGLLGRNIQYSFSQKYFTAKFQELGLTDHSYQLLDTQTLTPAVLQTLADDGFVGLNVTIPYKEQVLPFLTMLSPRARDIGAVNTILLQKEGSLVHSTGYNTDFDGFEKTLAPYLPLTGEAMLLGDGGAAKAVKAVLKTNKIPFTTISRKHSPTFEELMEADNPLQDVGVIIQCTPVGTFPALDSSVPFPWQYVQPHHLFIDLIYNPTETEFLRRAKELGCRTCNGLTMLHGQAEAAWEIWNRHSKKNN